MCPEKLFGALILKIRFFRVMRWAIDWRRFLMKLVLRTGGTDDAEVGGPICYEAFKTIAGLTGPMPKDMPYTYYTDQTLRRLAALEPRTLATMHGSSFRGASREALFDPAKPLRETSGKREIGF
jgi:hypothetical protein